MARKLYPIGIQTFERIRKEDKFYVDKTAYVYQMTHTNGTYFFLSRPRRFGKSLLVSTFLYELALPNQEIRVGLFGSLLPHYLGRNSVKGNTTIARVSVLIRQGRMDDALGMLADFLETIPYCDNTHYEGHFQQMLYIIFALLTDYDIQVEQHTARGRIDITLETRTDIYVMELKFGKSAEEALRQIDARHYADAFKMKGKPVAKVGLNFSLKDGVNCLEWEIGM